MCIVEYKTVIFVLFKELNCRIICSNIGVLQAASNYTEANLYRKELRTLQCNKIDFRYIIGVIMRYNNELYTSPLRIIHLIEFCV